MNIAMAGVTRLDSKVCCFCEYWDGQRSLEFRMGTLYAVQAQYNPQGRCSVRNNSHMSFNNDFAERCPAYKRWHQLPGI